MSVDSTNDILTLEPFNPSAEYVHKTYKARQFFITCSLICSPSQFPCYVPRQTPWKLAIGYIHPLIPKRNLDGNMPKGKSAIKLSMKLNMTSVRELVVLHSTPSMFDRFLVQCLEVVGRFEQQTFYIGSIEGRTHFGLPKRC